MVFRPSVVQGTVSAAARALYAILAAVWLVWPTTADAQERVVDEIVAVVDTEVLLRSDVNGVVFNILQQNQVSFTDDIWEEALQNLIDQKVLAIHARRDTTLIVEQAEVEQMLDQRIAQMSARVGGQVQLEEIYGKGIREIKEALRADFEGQLLAERFRGRRLQKIKITPTEVEEWFASIPSDSLPEVPASVRISHIVRFPEITEEAKRDARTVLTTIRDSIVVGNGSFEELAEQFSEDPGSAAAGGRYANSRLRDFVAEFSAVVSRLKPGEVSDIFETEFGLHIVRLNRRRGDVVDVNQILIGYDRTKFDPEPAIELLAQLKDSVLTGGARFEQLARRYSKEPSSATRGGRVVDPRTPGGRVYLDALGPFWKGTLATLEAGDISDPSEVTLLDGRSAYHIVQLQDRMPAHRVDLVTDYDLVREFALQAKQTEKLESWLDRLRRDVYIDIRGRGATTAANQVN